MRVVVGLACGLLPIGCGGMAAAAPLPRLTQEQLKVLNVGALDRYLEQIGESHQVPALTVGRVVQALWQHHNPISLPTLLGALGHALGTDLGREGRVLGVLLVLTVLAAVLERLLETFPERGPGPLARAVVLAVLVGVAVSAFLVTVGTVRAVIGDLVGLMEASLPTLVVLMAASGAVTSAGIFHPLLLLVVNTIAMACQDVILPMVLVAVAVELTGTWMPRFGLGQLGSLLRQLAVFFLGGLMTVFLGVIAMVNVAGKMSDSLALRAGKFLTNAMIPVVGKMFSDAMDVVLRSSGLLLASAGLAVGFAVIVAILFPLLKVLAVMLLYRLGAVAAEPLGVAGVGQTLTVLANGMGLLAAVAASVALMFFIVTTIVVAAAGGVSP